MSEFDRLNLPINDGSDKSHHPDNLLHPCILIKFLWRSFESHLTRAAERRLGGRELAARQRRARPLARVDRGRRRARGLDRADARALPLATLRGLAWRAGGRRAQHGDGAGCKRWARCMIPKHGTAHHALQGGHSCAEAARGSLCASPFAPTVTASPFHLSPAGGSAAQAVPGGGRLAHTHIGAARARVR